MTINLLPTPKEVALARETVQVGPRSPIAIRGHDLPEAVVRELLVRGTGATPIAIRHDSRLAAEAYRVEVAREGIELAASERAGLLYGLECLRHLLADGVHGDGRACIGRVADDPALSLRGMHLRFSIPSLTFEQAQRMLEAMGRWRLNTVLLEYNGQFPYRRHPGIPAPDALTPDQVSSLLAQARRLGIETIPLHQCLGHMEFVLQRDGFGPLSEEAEFRDQFCPLNPEAFAIFRDCVDDLLETHPGVRFFHIGGDETRRLGNCPRCAEVAAREGKGRLYLDYVLKAAEYVRSRGLTPIVWDDMLCAHKEILADMPRDIVIMYWDYWTVTDPSPMVVARPAGRGIVADRAWYRNDLRDLGEVEERMVRHFAQPLDLSRDLPPAFQHDFARYLGPDYPQRIRAFPFLEYYQDLGFRVIGAPTGGGNTSTWHGLPDFPRYADNILAFGRRLREAGALGMITTAWYDFPPESVYPGIMYTGQFAWHGGPPEARSAIDEAAAVGLRLEG